MKLTSPEFEYDNEIHHETENPALNLPAKNESHRSSASTLDQQNAKQTSDVHFIESMHYPEE